MEQVFPLLGLPHDVIIGVLQNMNYYELLSFSLVSMKTRSFVVSLDFGDEKVEMGIYQAISLNVFTKTTLFSIDFYYQDLDSPVDLTLPVAHISLNEVREIQSSTPFNFGDWMSHIKTVFRWPVNVRFSRGCERFDVEELRNALGEINKLDLGRGVTQNNGREILKHFSHSSSLHLGSNPFEEDYEAQKLLIQNYTKLGFSDSYSLDDMLMANSEEVEFYHLNSNSQKQFNRFLKHWIRGSNARLQKMTLSIRKTDFINGETYLNGIQLMDISEEMEMEMRQKYNIFREHLEQIRRNDGTTALVATEDRNFDFRIQLIVLE